MKRSPHAEPWLRIAVAGLLAPASARWASVLVVPRDVQDTVSPGCGFQGALGGGVVECAAQRMPLDTLARSGRPGTSCELWPSPAASGMQTPPVVL